VQQVIPPGLKESPKQEKKRSRLKDDLAISPDQTKIGKRQRKVNSLYSGYAIDKVRDFLNIQIYFVSVSC
jgi:hypothetical protein